MVRLVDPDKCTGCGECEYACAFGLITMDKETNRPIIDSDNCRSCCVCLSYCETRAIDED